MIVGLPYWLGIPILLGGAIAGWALIFTILRALGFMNGEDEPKDPAAGLRRKGPQ